MKKILVLILLLAVFNRGFSQALLDEYIALGLANNESIKQQNFLLEKNMYALEEARRLFLPAVTLNSSYTLAAGGRTVDFPVGDILNPVYQTLNQLTQSNRFPVLENQSILLNPNNFYDIKVRTAMPLLNAEIYYNQKIKQQQVDIQRIELNVYRRELVKEIKKAYYQYCQSARAVSIYENVLLLVKENQRVNQSLYNNQKVNRTAIARADNEFSKINASLQQARESQKTAAAYFNFLLNRPLVEAVQYDSLIQIPEIAQDTAVSKREELMQLSTLLNINNQVLKLNKSYRIPKISAFVDIGSQGFNWQLNNKTRYFLAGVSLDMNLFAANRNRYKIRQSEMDIAVTQSKQQYVEDQLRLQLTSAVNAYRSAQASLRAATEQEALAGKFYSDMLKLYKEGQALYIELLDAQNQLSNAMLQKNISQYEVLIKSAEVERASASFNLK